MKYVAIALLLAVSPAAAQYSDDGYGPLARGLEDMMRDLFSQVEPRLRELRDAIDNLDDYEAPEMLPNGDIIIRRKTPPGEAPEPQADPEDTPGEAVDI